jgi:hypothetical protein
LLAGCATIPDGAREAAEANEQIAANFRDNPDDAATLAALTPEKLAREGRTLKVRTGARSFKFTDKGLCEGNATCERYRADRLLHGQYLGVRMFTGEYPDSYLIIDTQGGRRLFDTGERPVAGPAAPLAALADGGEINEPILGGLAVVDLERRRVLWHRPDWYLDARIEAWEGPRCVRASHVPGLDREGARRTIWIVEDGGRWQAQELRPPTCEASA